MTTGRATAERVGRAYRRVVVPACALMALALAALLAQGDVRYRDPPIFGPLVIGEPAAGHREIWELLAIALLLLASAAMLVPLVARRRAARLLAACPSNGRRFLLVRPTSFVRLAVVSFVGAIVNVEPVRDWLLEFVSDVSMKGSGFASFGWLVLGFVLVVPVLGLIASPFISSVVFALGVVREARGVVVAEWAVESGYRDAASCRVLLQGRDGERDATIERVDGRAIALAWKDAEGRPVSEIRVLARDDQELLSELRAASARHGLHGRVREPDECR